MSDMIWVDAQLANPRRQRRAFKIRAIVDNGSTDSAMPSKLLRKIGVQPRGRETYEAWAGKIHRRLWGEVEFRIQDKFGTSRVTFEPDREVPTIGALTLEALGFDIDMINGKLRPGRRRMGRGPRLRRKIPLRAGL